jgi:hypothetical protein
MPNRGCVPRRIVIGALLDGGSPVVTPAAEDPGGAGFDPGWHPGAAAPIRWQST